MKRLLWLFTFAVVLHAQPTQCNDAQSVTGTGRTVYINFNQVCNTWVLTYQSSGLSALSIQVETSNDNSTFTAVSSNVLVGSNPSTTLTGMIQLQAYGPYIGVNVTTFTTTGSITWTLKGSSGVQANVKSGGGSGGSCATLGGDLSGTCASATVINLSGVTNSSLANSGLANPATTVNGQICTLGGTCTVTAGPTGSSGGVLGGTYPNPSSVLGATSAQGNGLKVQLSTGSPVSGDCAKFDANANVVDAGSACGSGGGTFTPGTVEGIAGSQHVGPIYSITAPGLVASFTQVNSTGTTYADLTSGGISEVSPTNGSANSLRMLSKALPAPPYSFVIGLQIGMAQQGVYWFAGWRDSSSGKVITCDITTASATVVNYRVMQWTNPTTFASDAVGAVGIQSIPVPLFIKLADNGTNRTCSIGTDGTTFFQVYTATNTTFLTPDSFVVGQDPASNASTMTFFSQQ